MPVETEKAFDRLVRLHDQICEAHANGNQVKLLLNNVDVPTSIHFDQFIQKLFQIVANQQRTEPGKKRSCLLYIDGNLFDYT